MKTKQSILVLTYCLLSALCPRAQCPDKHFLWNRLVLLRDSSIVTHQQQLKELLTYAGTMDKCAYKNDSTHAFLMRRIGRLYFEQADFLKAVQYLQQSIDISSDGATSGFFNPKQLMQNYYWLSVYYDSLNNVPGKMRAIDSCVDIAIRSRIYSDASYIWCLIARMEHAYDVGDYNRCIDDASMCELLARQYASTHVEGFEVAFGVTAAESSLGWRINAMLRLGNFNALEKFLLGKVVEYRNNGLTDYLGLVYTQLAEVEEYKNNYNKALEYLRQSLNCQELSKDYFNCKQTAKDIGHDIYFKHFGDFNNAMSNYRRALRYVNTETSKDAADIYESLSIYCNIADVYVAKHKFDSAFYFFQLAFDQIKQGSSEASILRSSNSDFIRNKKVHYLSSLFIDKGNAYKEQYMAKPQPATIRQAIDICKQADQLLDRIKSEQTDLQSKLFWRSDSRRLYEQGVEACNLANDLDNAFYFFEKSRAVLLNDQLNQRKWSGEQDIMREAQLEKTILQMAKQLDTADKSSMRYSALQNGLFKNRQDLQDLQELIKKNNPLYFQNFINKNDFITIKETRNLILGDHQALVELLNGDSAVYVLAITSQNSFLKKISKPLFDSLSTVFTKYISNLDLLNKQFNIYKEISFQLYQLIFKNIDLPSGRIIISPGAQFFPFEALVTNLQPLAYFLDDHSVSYTYSARFLLTTFNVSTSEPDDVFMGLAPVKFANYPDLTGSDKSLVRIQKYFKGATNLIGNDASKNNFLSRYYKYKVIQLYTHATDGGLNGEPMIFWADSSLSLSDLLPEKRPATDLIVLSACQTASGKLYSGEGVFSFNRSFAALGIPSSVANLWRVDDDATYKLTELFYKYMSRGMPLDLALQKAKKEFREQATTGEYKLPYYWAAPILVGKSDEIPLQRKSDWSLFTSLAFLSSFIFSGWMMKKTKIFQA